MELRNQGYNDALQCSSDDVMALDPLNLSSAKEPALVEAQPQLRGHGFGEMLMKALNQEESNQKGNFSEKRHSVRFGRVGFGLWSCARKRHSQKNAM